MSKTFFENPLYVYIALGFAELILAVIWYERRHRTWIKSLIVPPVLAVVVALVAHFVVTDREQIIAAARDIAEAIEQQQFQRIPEHLDEKFVATLNGRSVGKDKVTALCNAEVDRWGITGVNFHNMSVEVTPTQARMHLTTFVFYGREGSSRTALIWDVLWIRRDGRWRIREVAEPQHGFEL